MLDRMLLASASEEKLFVEDCFATHLYTGNGSTQTITNGIDLSGKGGMVWIKSRSAATNNFLFDTARGVNAELNSNTTDVSAPLANSVTAFNSNGFALGSASGINVNAATYTSWTFRKAPKFFDVVTYTGNGTLYRQIPHNLGIQPGFIVVKNTTLGDPTNWATYFSVAPNQRLLLNTTGKSALNGYVYDASATTFTLGIAGNMLNVNESGYNYVAYVFGHDTTADGLIRCGQYTGNGSLSGPIIDLGWEPQWLMIRNQEAGNWQIIDNLRGMPVGSADATLQANLSNAESAVDYISPTSTGFQVTSTSSEVNANSESYVYIAIRRGPMKTPTVGTSVFAPVARTGTSTFTPVSISAGFTPDLYFNKDRKATQFGSPFWYDRLRGKNQRLISSSTNAEGTVTTDLTSFDMNGITTGTSSTLNYTGVAYINYFFKRAPGFFDVVCYTGTGVARTVNHNLGVAPELMIVKSRSSNAYGWQVYSANLANTEYLVLNTAAAKATGTTRWNSTTPTSTVFTVGTDATVNASGGTYVAYLFATCPGVSKVGTYIGTGESDGSPAAPQTINCGFSSGARFVLIKDLDGSDGWFVFDTARGITTTESPWLTLNSTNAESSGTGNLNYVEPNSSGFYLPLYQNIINPCNYLGRKYIYLAIA